MEHQTPGALTACERERERERVPDVASWPQLAVDISQFTVILSSTVTRHHGLADNGRSWRCPRVTRLNDRDGSRSCMSRPRSDHMDNKLQVRTTMTSQRVTVAQNEVEVFASSCASGEVPAGFGSPITRSSCCPL